MSNLIKRDDVLRIIDGRFSQMMIGDILKQDINALPAAAIGGERKEMSDYIKKADAVEVAAQILTEVAPVLFPGTIAKELIKKRMDELPEAGIRTAGRQCKIDRCELFNRLATITGEDANDMKAKIYAVIQEMDPVPAARRGSWEVRPAPEDDRVLGRRRYYCSECGGWNTYGMSDFCPRCGADMRKTEPQLTPNYCGTCKHRDEPSDEDVGVPYIEINGKDCPWK